MGKDTLRCAGFTSVSVLPFYSAVLCCCCKFQSRDTVMESRLSRIIPAQEAHCVSVSKADLSHISSAPALPYIRG